METMNMDDDTTSAEPGEGKTEDRGDDAKKKKPAVRRHKCPRAGCTMSFRKPCDLNAHVDFTHKGRYHNVCDHIIDKKTGTKCGWKFERRCTLTRHKNTIHSTVCKYPCLDCPKVFNRPDNLKEHWDAVCSPPGDPVRTQYKCKVCEKGFPTSKNCSDHYLYNCAPRDDPKRVAHLKKKRQQKLKKRTKDSAKHHASWIKKGGAPSKFGQIDGVSRDEEIKALNVRIMGSPAGALLGSFGEATVTKWKERHGNASLRDVSMNREGKIFAMYMGTTMQDITPGDEEKCPESRAFLHEDKRNPLVRINDKEDLRRFTQAEAGSVIETFVLMTSDNRYDITCIEGEMQYYLEDLGMAHGIRLHQKAGAGSRLPGSESVHEKNRLAKGETIIYSLFVTLIEMRDPVFADEVDPEDPTPTIPRLLSATVIGHMKGIPTTFEIEVRGHKQPFRDTPSVLEDRKEVKRLEKQSRVTKKKRDAALKSATTSAPTADCVQEPLKKKQKTVAAQLVQ
ncbi:hypothetical protein T484DRAFT_1757033 [Baffinella frigidus]|nr:hypothetical protein T484DRAFT_1757033 [Cryptophyta sp. CCMP2293]